MLHLCSGNQEIVVFDLYGEGSEGCSKKKLGTYEVTVPQFLKALLRQKILEYYMVYGKDMKVDKSSIYYLSCYQYYYNNVLVGLHPNNDGSTNASFLTTNCFSPKSIMLNLVVFQAQGKDFKLLRMSILHVPSKLVAPKASKFTRIWQIRSTCPTSK